LVHYDNDNRFCEKAVKAKASDPLPSHLFVWAER
jgi:hypothetical protein